MTSPISFRLFAPAAVLAVVLAWAGVGSASCGDYLYVLPPAGDQPHVPPLCPCQYGECHPPVPVPESGEPTTTELSRSADALLVLNPTSPDPTAGKWPVDSTRRPHRTSSGVFHPPRH